MPGFYSVETELVTIRKITMSSSLFHSKSVRGKSHSLEEIKKIQISIKKERRFKA
jgi:hypothetical protein